jgi:predicted ArsR family transcriptional regulator
MSEQLKFIVSVFKLTTQEILNVMGPESVQTVFRLMGEHQGEAIERRLRKKYKVDNQWKINDFGEAIVKDVINPSLGEEAATYTINNGELTLKIGICPFERANMKISTKLYCTFTEGMIETAFKKALKNIEFKREALIADRKEQCIFKVKPSS